MSAVHWIGIAILCGVIEVLSSGFWFLWLALSALLVALGVSLGWLVNLGAQLLVFSFFTLLFVIFTRPLVMKFIKHNETHSNVKALIGQHGITTSDISPIHYGQVKVNGEIWTAVSQEDIAVGTRIVVEGIDGVKLLVAKA